MSDPAFTITPLGTWPNEEYSIGFNNALVSPLLGAYPAQNYFRYSLNHTNDANSLVNFYYLNATPTISDTQLVALDTNSNSTLLWAISADRRNFNAYTFNSFNLDALPGNQKTTNKLFYSYLLNPSRLLLAPTSKPYYDGSSWVLTTQAQVTNLSTFFFTSDTSQYADAAAQQIAVMQTPPTSVSLQSLNLTSNYSIVYNLCACRTRVDVPVITFVNNNNPTYFAVNLETSPYGYAPPVIRPNSTYVSYQVKYFSDFSLGGYIINLGQIRPDVLNVNIQGFTGAAIIGQDVVKNIQTYQMVQSNQGSDNSLGLSNPIYSALSSIINLNTSNFQYYSNSYQTRKLTVVNNITGISGTFIGVSYIADCPTFALSKETWQSTIKGFTINSGGGLGVSIPLANNGSDTVTWKTKYPPHYYSFKASVVGPTNPWKVSSPTIPLETASLTFFLVSSAVSYGVTNSYVTTAVTLSSYISSDYNIFSYDLPTASYKDYIKYSAITNTPTIINALSCYYGPKLNIPYNLKTSPWVPVSAADNFLITYPNTKHGEISFFLRPTLSSLAGLMDAYQATQIKLAESVATPNIGKPIFITKIQETQDYMEVGSSFLNCASAWPTKDLRNSLVSWSVYPTGRYVTINAVNLSGNFIQTIPPLSAVLWNSRTFNVVCSGYGSTPTVLTLSSQKYNQVASVTSVSSLFNLYKEGYLLVGPSVQLNNLNQTRTITLTAAIPYNGRTYYLPNSSILNWRWSYDGNSNFNITPISAYYISNNSTIPYKFGSSILSPVVSSIYINVVPPVVNISPKLHKISIIPSVNTPYGIVQGTYNFSVDDFPSTNIFNTYFTGAYQGFPNTILTDTGKGFSVITRSPLTTNNYKFTPYPQAVSNLRNSTVVWTVSSDTNSNITSYNGLSAFNYSAPNVGTAIITLSALSAFAPNWISAHNIQSYITINILNPIDFSIPLNFLTIPNVYWLNGQQLTITTPNNYTFASTSTAFANKISNSQAFYLSANKSYFTNYQYYVGAEYSSLASVNSNYQLVDIPYRSEFFSSTGLPVHLVAYNNTTYPSYNGTTYYAPVGNTLKKFNFNNTSNSINAGSFLSPGYNGFNYSPRLIPYSVPTLSYTPNTTALEIDFNRTITITQTIDTNPLNSPAQIQNGTVTYTLSSAFWKVNKDVPAINGTYDIFSLTIGDTYIPLRLSDIADNNLNLSASANIVMQIPQNTFDNYNITAYAGNRNLWKPVNEFISLTATSIVAYSTAGLPQIFVSTNYVLTGSDFFIQYQTPSTSSNFYTVAYITDFGEDFSDSIRVSDIFDSVFYNYTNAGTYYISYSAIQNDGSVLEFQNPNPITVDNQWSTYDPNNLRKVENAILTPPYTQNEVLVQPNEFGDVDIFNTCITRLQDCITYLRNNLITLDTNTPTVYYGWLGCNSQLLSKGIQWYTQDIYSQYVNRPSYATSKGTSHFSDIKDIKEVNDYIFVLDGSNVRTFSAGYIPIEIPLVGLDEIGKILIRPTSIEVDETGSLLYISDTPANRVYRFDLDLYQQYPDINIALSVGGLGSINDPTRFNSPSDLVYANQKVFVLDYNNRCIKEYNADLGWLFTYYSDDFIIDTPINIAVHPVFGFVYVLTKSNHIYVFDNLNTTYISKFVLTDFNSSSVSKIMFDEIGDFFYVVTPSLIYKYTSDGYFVNTLNLPTGITFNGGKPSNNRSLLFFGSNYIIKVQDVLKLHSVGEGLATEYWSNDQITIDRDEFAIDSVYNRSLIRLAQNFKTFRSSLNAKLVLATEQTASNTITYFAVAPIYPSDLPVFDSTIEEEIIGVGVNELHLPPVLNKELVKFYDAVVQFTSLLSINNFNVNQTGGCTSGFCWSWKAMSCYNLSLPAVRICSINPITYAELKSTYPNPYAPSNTWGSAISDCCSKVSPPV